MAIIATVEKRPVQYRQPKLWNITLNLTLIDDGVEVINKDYSAEYIPGDYIPSKTEQFSSMMQADIDKYKSEQVIYTAAALNTAVTTIGEALVV
jgi:hypothetical protein